MKTNAITVTPVKKYAPPKYPTLTDAQTDPKLLRKLPSRWEKNAAVVAAVGMLGAMSLTACGVSEITTNGNLTPTSFTSEQGTTNFLNYKYNYPYVAGGDGPPKALTEQDILAIIENMLEYEGLNLESDLSKYPNITNDEIIMYDFEHQVAIGYNWYQEESHKNYDGILMGRFSEPGLNPDDEEQLKIFYEYMAKLNELYGEYHDEDNILIDEIYYQKRDEIQAEYVATIKPFEEELRQQVRDFIEWLQAQGII